LGVIKITAMKKITFQNVLLTIITICLVTITLFISGLIKSPIEVVLSPKQRSIDVNARIVAVGHRPERLELDAIPVEVVR
jgi:hypothetical protein